MNIPIEVAAYLAGVLDSDGWIGVQRSTYAMRVRGDAGQAVYGARMAVKQVEPAAVDLLHATFGGHRYLTGPSSHRGRQLWVWQVHSAACRPILEAVLPHLRIKRAPAENALVVCGLAGTVRRFAVPAVIPGEPMVTAYEAAERLPYGYASICQAVRKGSVPFIRDGRRILIPESFLEVWANRGTSPSRSAGVTAQLEACYQRAKVLNHVGV